MLYKFKSKAAGDVIMMSPNGDQVLRIIGKEPSPKGIIEVADMPAAVQAIEAAIAADEAQARQADEEARANGEAPPPRGITLRQRVWPLVEMMKHAQREDHDIVWGV